MRSPPGHHQPDNGGPASSARLTLAPVDPVPGLELAGCTLRVSVVAHARSAQGDSLGQHPPQSVVEFSARRRGQIRRTGQRMDASPVQGLIAVNVAHAAEWVLIQQQGFDLPTAGDQLSPLGQRDPQRIGRYRRNPPTDPTFCLIRISVYQPHSSEPPRVAEAQFHRLAAESNPQVRMLGRRLVRRSDDKPSGHAQVDNQGPAAAEADSYLLAGAGDPLNPTASKRIIAWHVGAMGNARLDQAHRINHPPGQSTLKTTRNRFYFRKFRHDAVLYHGDQAAPRRDGTGGLRGCTGPWQGLFTRPAAERW
jgi:hypothetical protein